MSSFTYKWEKVCSRFEKYSIGELRRLAELEGVNVPPSMIKREICALLADKRVAKEQRQCEIQQATIPTCTNTSGLREEFEEIPPHLFYSFEQDGQTYCDNVRDWKALLLGSQTNPYTRSPFPLPVQTEILEKNKYLDAALLKKCGNELSVEISRAFPGVEEEFIAFLRLAEKRKFRRFVKVLLDKDIIDRIEHVVIANISNLNHAKTTLCYIVQEKLAQQGENRQGVFYTNVYMNYFLDADERAPEFNPNISSLFEGGKEALIMAATPVQFNRFVSMLERGDVLPRTLTEQKRFIIDSYSDVAVLALRDYLEENSRPAHLTMIERHRIFALFLAVCRNANSRDVADILVELDSDYNDVSTRPFYHYWRHKCLDDDTCIETFNTITLVLGRRFACENKIQKYLSRDELRRCIEAPLDYSIFSDPDDARARVEAMLVGRHNDAAITAGAIMVDAKFHQKGLEFLTRMIGNPIISSQQ